MMFKVFIDGGEGTTGLRLAQRLKQRTDIELLTISSDLRKNLDARLEKIVFLCAWENLKCWSRTVNITIRQWNP